MRPSEKAWIALLGAIAVYEIVADEDEMLSHAVDRWLITHPVVTWAAIGLTAMHLLNLLPEAVDPWHWGFSWKKHFVS